jgi:hypothetical protein
MLCYRRALNLSALKLKLSLSLIPLSQFWKVLSSPLAKPQEENINLMLLAWTLTFR